MVKLSFTWQESYFLDLNNHQNLDTFLHKPCSMLKQYKLEKLEPKGGARLTFVYKFNEFFMLRRYDLLPVLMWC
jgi:hypothetical protein